MELVTLQGKLEVYFEHTVYCANRKQALVKVADSLDSESVTSIEGNIHTINGSSLPFTFDKCKITWIDNEI